MTKIITVGTMAIDYRVANNQVILGGGGFNSTIAAALYDAQVTAVTPFSRPVSGIAKDLYHALEHTGAGVKIVSQDGAKPPISVFNDQQAVLAKKPSDRIRDNDFFFNPLKAPGIKEIEGDVAAFVGIPTVFDGTRPALIELAKNFAGEGKTVIWNSNARGPVRQSIMEEWAQTAQIVTLSTRDIKPQFGEDLSEQAVSRRLLDMGKESPTGTRLVCITYGEKGCAAFWEEKGRIYGADKMMFGCWLPARPYVGGEQDGAGDAFAAGVAMSADTLKPGSHDIRLNADKVVKIVNKGQQVAAGFLTQRNSSSPNRPKVFDVLLGQSLEAIKASIYPEAASG